MTVRDSDADAVRADNGRLRGDDDAALDFTPDFERLKLALFFFTTDVERRLGLLSIIVAS